VNSLPETAAQAPSWEVLKLNPMSVGPTVSYIHPLGKVTLIVDGSWLAQVKTANTPKENSFRTKITFAF
jgi:hypothetical protein